MVATFLFPFPLAAAAEESSDLREEADGGRLLVRRLGGAAEAAELIAVFAAEFLRASRDAAAAGEAGAEGVVELLLRFNWPSAAPSLAYASFAFQSLQFWVIMNYT